MNKFKIAHIREQGQDMIIVPLSSSFESKSSHDQQETIEALQICAASANLAGTVVAVWQVGARTRFIAPPAWHPFFKSVSWAWIMAQLNKELSCG